MPGITGKLVKSSRKIRNINEIGDTSTNPFCLNPNKKYRRPSAPVLCLDPELFCSPIRSLTSLLNDDNDDHNHISLENFQVPTDPIDDLIKSENEKLHKLTSESSVMWREMAEMAAEKLEVKNSEMQELLRNYAEHVENVASEAEFWKGKAKKMEKKVRYLEEVMSHQRGEGEAEAEAEEESGESSFVDAQRYEPVARLSCKVCGIGVANIMFWPCKHLCVCRRCDGNIEECPICKVSKRMSVEVCLP